MNSEPLDWYLDQQDKDHEAFQEGLKMKFIAVGAKPCPFCGGTDICYESVRGTRYLRCNEKGCGATGGHVYNFEDVPFTDETALKRWNTRNYD